MRLRLALSFYASSRGQLYASTTRRQMSMVSDFLRLDDTALLRECRVDVRRDSGPGGQNRNKIESAVRITHEPTNMVANAAEERSQHKNKAIALKRLRKKIAFEVRRGNDWLPEPAIDETSAPLDDDICPPELLGFLPWKRKKGTLVIGKKSELKPIAEQALLDVFDAAKGSTADCARYLGTSTSQLSKLLTADDNLLSAANAIRNTYGTSLFIYFLIVFLGLGPLRRR